MTINKESTEKKCCFYASDFHLEMTIVPYINKKIEDNYNVVIITENNLKETVNILISRMNIKNKEKILELDWNNKDEKNAIGKNNAVIIINGSKEFIQNKNNQLENALQEPVKEIIDCYSFEEIKDEIVETKNNYKSVLNNLQKDY